MQTDQQHEADTQREQQITVMRRDYFIHSQLQKQRADDGEELQRSRKQKNLAQSAFQSNNASGQVSQLERTSFITRSECSSRRQFQGNTGEVPAGLVVAESSRAHGRIMHHNVTLGRFLQHDKMVHVPMQYARGLQVGDVFKFDANGASG